MSSREPATAGPSTQSDGKPSIEVGRGSLPWVLRVAESAAWCAILLILVVVQTSELDRDAYLSAIVLTAALGGWTAGLFRWLIPTRGDIRSAAWGAMGLGLTLTTVLFAVLYPHVAGAGLVFVPLVFVTALLGRFPEAVGISAISILAYILASAIVSRVPDPATATLTAGSIVLSGIVPALLARELRTHYRGEQKEHRLATAVRYRLMAVLDAVDEAIVFSDRAGVVRVVNRRAAELFGLGSDQGLGLPRVQLLRELARQSEDPEGFMELFQALLDDPDLELRSEVEQILPVRRQLRLYSGPAHDENGIPVGRIDVYTDVSESVRRAAENERLYDQARRTAESYQRGLLPDSAPSLPRVGLVCHYLPASGDRGVCGDFYDFVPLADGRLAVVLGDVCGIGPRAAGDAALTRYTLSSFAPEMEGDVTPGTLLQELARRIAGRLGPERFVKILVVTLDPERAVLEYASAGHVPPLVHRAATGEVVWLEEGGCALGVEVDAEYKSERIELEPGDLALLYTDGVTNAARHGETFGSSRIVGLVQDYAAGSAGEVVSAVVRSLQAWSDADGLRDDAALVACRVVPDEAMGEPVRELVVPNEPARAGEMRRFVGSFLADLRVSVEISTEVLMAVGEAVANAVRHARRPEGRGQVRVRCALEGDEVVVTVADDGPGFDIEEARSRPRDPFAAGGRGLFLIDELSDRSEITSSSEGSSVTMARRIRG